MKVLQCFQAVGFKYPACAPLRHVLTIDFPAKFQSWDLDPGILFDAPVQKKEATPKARVVKHLEESGKGAAHLVLWLDCDREGENICFEVMDAVLPVMRPAPGQQHVWRAKFSAVTKESIETAMRTLGVPNENEARAVDARQELDLKIGVAFTRFQTRYFQGKYGNLDASVISYGPCQIGTRRADYTVLATSSDALQQRPYSFLSVLNFTPGDLVIGIHPPGPSTRPRPSTSASRATWR